MLNKLGQGGSSIKYAAIDLGTKHQVAIKALSLTGLENWKKIELFEREAKILQQLDNPAIPKYLDYFQIETANDVDFYIVQQLAPGQSLAHLISQGWTPEESTVKNIAEQVLEILVYLQQITPPVIHRDIKPQNIIYQPDTGKLFLVDFGAVQDTYHHTVMGSTVVGTYGYMAPEQFRGGALLSTDLYGLGCTLLFLLTGKPPVELPQKKLKLDFRDLVWIDSNLADWIDKLIEPNAQRRFPKAEAALSVLQEKKALAEYDRDIIIKPKYSAIAVSRTPHTTIVDIPPPFKRKKVDPVYYFWLGWSIISILNRLAIFVSIALIGKLYIFVWLYHLLFTHSKALSLKTQLVFFAIFLVMLASGYSLTIPFFSVCLIAIDFLIDLILKHNFIRQLLFKYSIAYDHKSHDFTVIKTWMKLSYQEKYKHSDHFLSKAFLTIPEQDWLEAEINK
ncbi:MAG: serine/threonine-protein kinase [Cyanobacteria bacterium P01_G01_bin.19]